MAGTKANSILYSKMIEIMKRFLILSILTMLLFSNITASGGSVYTRYGLGDVSLLYTARRLGLGTPGTALKSFNHLSNYNPASIYDLTLTRIEVGMIYKGVSLDTDPGSYYDNVDFSGFAFGFPADKDLGISFIAGISPYTELDYAVNSPEGEYSFEGNGGISKIFLGSSVNTGLGFILGAEFDYYTGKTIFKTNYEPEGNDQITGYESKYDFYGIGLGFGLLSENLALKNNWNGIFSDFRIGATFSLPFTINTDSVIYSLSDIGRNKVIEEQVETELPIRLGAGVLMTFNKKYTIMADYMYEPWTDLKISGTSLPLTSDLQRIGLGFEYKDPETRFSPYWEQIALRGGLSYEQTKYNIKGENLISYGIHGGISFPLGTENSLDVGLMAGIRTTSDPDIYREYIYRAAFTLSFGELWFVRQNR